MPRTCTSLTLEDAKRMLSAAEAKAASLRISYNIAMVDAGGHLVAFVRQDGALIGSIDLAIDKAVTARIFDKPTTELAGTGAVGEATVRYSGNKCRQSCHLRRWHTRHGRREYRRRCRSERRNH